MLNNGEQWLTMGKDPKQKEPDSLLIIFDTSKYRSPKKENKTSFSLNRCFTLTNQIAQRLYAYSTLFLFLLLFSWFSLNRCFTLTNQIAQRFYAYSTLFLFLLFFSWFSLNRCFTLTNHIAQRFYAYSTLFLLLLLFSWYRAVSRTKHITCGICWVCMKEEVLWIVGAPPKSLMLLLLLLLWLDHAAPWMKYSMCRSYVGLGWEGGCVDSRPSQTSHTPWCTSLPKSAQSTRWAALKHSLFQVFLIYFSLKCADHQTL